MPILDVVEGHLIDAADRSLRMWRSGSSLIDQASAPRPTRRR